MSTYQAIAATTSTLQYLAGGAARLAVPEANVTLDPPEQQPAASRDEPRLNIYLVQAVPHPAMRSMDLPTRNGAGTLVTAPQVALNLRYLLSFFGPSTKAHLMLGAVEIALREHAVFDAGLIASALAGQPDLQGSRLEEQSPPVQLSPLPMTLEDLARFWSGFFQIPYALSSIYEASVVVIDSALPPAVTLPVRTVNVTVAGAPPQLDPIPGVDYAPGALVPVSGPGLTAGLLVEVGGQWSTLEPTDGAGLAFRLPASVPAGVLMVHLGVSALGGTTDSVIDTATTGVPPAPSAGSGPSAPPPGPAPAVTPPALIPGSNAQPLVVRPVVSSAQFDQAGALVTVTVAPAPGPSQPVALSLVGLQPAGNGQAASVRLAMPSSRAASVVSFATPALPPGPYLVIVEVDGAASSPVFSGAEYDQPQVQIT